MKRTFDVVTALFGCILSLPILLVIVPIIRLDSTGNAIFRQRRIGFEQKPFTCYKLRTMQNGTRQAGTHEISGASITRVGRFLRATKIDEIPQLWNVLMGEMSLVGPRPCLPSQYELIAEREKKGVFLVLPGITGLAQIDGIDMSDPVRLATRDAEYVAAASFWLDVKILAMTVLGKGSGDRIKQ